ncbi:MAG: hypothetical protein FWE33_01730 [Defluviitaleaceae bacterium]|nr:hypothetical protein [Defluviitaleaceae bacterium]
MVNVYPVKDVQFKVSTVGRLAVNEDDHQTIRGMENFSISFDNGIEEWKPLDAMGWSRRMMTAKSMTVGLSGKRVVNCPGNDYIAGLAYQNGNLAESNLWVIFPNGDQMTMDCVINVTACGGGSSTDIAVLEFECLSDGIPLYMRNSGDVLTPSPTLFGGDVNVSN